MTPHTVHNLIRTIVSKQSNSTDADRSLRAIILSFRPDLDKHALPTDKLLITALKDCHKKEVTYNYKYETKSGTNEEQHVASPALDTDIFIKMWRLRNVDREEACVLAGAVRDLCNAVLKNVHPDFDPDHDHSAAVLLKMYSDVRYLKHHAYEENLVMEREMKELDSDLRESRAKVAELLASFSNFKADWERKLAEESEKTQISENEIARLEFSLFETKDKLEQAKNSNTLLTNLVEELQLKLQMQTEHYEKCCKNLEESEINNKDNLSKIKYLEIQLQQISDDQDARLVLTKQEHEEKIRLICQKHEIQLQEKSAQISTLEQRLIHQTTLAEDFSQKLAKISDNNALLQAKLIDAQQKIHALHSNSTQVTEEAQKHFDDYNKQVADLKIEISKLKLLNKQDTDSNTELQKQNVKLKKDFDLALLQLDDQKLKCEQLKAELDKLNKEYDDSTDSADRTYNLQKGQINRLESELARLDGELQSTKQKLNNAEQQIDEQDRTIKHCNYEIEALSKTKASSPPKSKLPIKHKLDNTSQKDKEQKIAKKGITWDVNKLYGIKTQKQLNQLIEQIKIKNAKNKEWPVYSKFLSCHDTTIEQLEANPEFKNLDENFKVLLLKQREFAEVVSEEEEASLFSN